MTLFDRCVEFLRLQPVMWRIRFRTGQKETSLLRVMRLQPHRCFRRLCDVCWHHNEARRDVNCDGWPDAYGLTHLSQTGIHVAIDQRRNHGNPQVINV